MSNPYNYYLSHFENSKTDLILQIIANAIDN